MRVVQISDLHLSADESVRRYDVSPWDRLKSVLDSLQQEEQQPQLMIVSGDVAHDHSEATYRKLLDLIEPMGVDYQVLPGNHDSPELIVSLFGKSGGPFSREYGPWLLVGCNSHLPGSIGGALEEDERSWILRQLRESRCQNKALFLHHPPVSVGNIFFDAVGLKEGTDFCAELESIEGLRLVCFGHIHRPFSVVRENVTYCAAPSTVHGYVGEEALEVAPDLFGYRIFDLGDSHFETEVRLLGVNS
ncbi:MAG: metallophosphoesterase [Myxococcota bacterium]|nr:metallophosphoesterase [Myxococcota bacterium]